VLAGVFRDEAGRLTAGLVRMFGDFELAEEIVQDTLLVALEDWRRHGVPERPGAWLTTVARRRAIDSTRRSASYAKKIAEIAARPALEAEGDERLELLFTCCHPALSTEAQVALTLRAVCGFTSAEIAGAFLVSPDTVNQRVSRARRKVVAAGIPYRVPSDSELPERLAGVLAVLYLMFNEGYLSSGAEAATRRDLAEDAAWLTRVASNLLPAEPEPLGLLALMQLHLARTNTRFDADGELVRLENQDRSRWDHAQIAGAVQLIERAASFHKPGNYQLQAAIAACHAEAPQWEATDWTQILMLYDLLVRISPTAVVKLNRAVALARAIGPEVALAELDSLAESLDGYHLFHATRGRLLLELGRDELARAADLRALELTANPAERSLLLRELRT
jgi:RNA polymerase sigma-70 factor (ECF subfamily)